MQDQDLDKLTEIDRNIKSLSQAFHENVTAINYKLGSLESIEKTGRSLRRTMIILSIISVFLGVFALLQLYVFLVLIGVIPD